jgi:hypothetical protein
MKKVIGWLLVFFMFFVLSGVAIATPEGDTSEAGVVPTPIDGNPLSGEGADNHKIENPDGGDTGSIDIPSDVELNDLGSSYPDVSGSGTVEVNYEVSSDGKYLSWSSTEKVDTVVVKGGNSANIYHYYDSEWNYLGLWDDDAGMWYDSGLKAPDFTNPVGIVIVPDISNFGFFKGPGTGGSNGGSNGGTNGGTNGGELNGGTNGGGNGGGSALGEFILGPEAPATDPLALPPTGGASSIAIALGLLLAGSGILIKRKNS